MTDDPFNKVWLAQQAAVRSMESNIVSLKKSIQELESKIEFSKTEGDYSVNHDCLRYATNIWQSCLRLHELKKLKLELEGKDEFGLPRRNENE